MLNKRIEFDPHATDMMMARGITLAMVLEVFARGTPFVAAQRKRGEYRYGLRRRIGEGVVRVVYFHRDDHYYVISVHWQYGLEIDS